MGASLRSRSTTPTDPISIPEPQAGQIRDLRTLIQHGVARLVGPDGRQIGLPPARAVTGTSRRRWYEKAATEHVVQTGNRRFRDDEFLIPRALTAGHSAIRIRVKFTPVLTPLYPGYPLPELAWSEMRYTAYSFVMPNF
jgi:hypothetical protein